MIEYLAPGFIYTLAKDAWAAIRRRRRRLSNAEVLVLRQKWKPLFEDQVWKTRSEKLREDVIIRDVKRIDKYPAVSAKRKGISPWFRVGLVGTYHKGILVGLRWGELTQHDAGDAWRYTDISKRETGDIDVVLIGRIPYENIEAVDWSGDEHYPYPHIYCHFDTRRQEPYDELVFCVEKCNPGGKPFYVELAGYDEVRNLSRSLKIESSV